jgi:hypothetical protein
MHVDAQLVEKQPVELGSSLEASLFVYSCASFTVLADLFLFEAVMKTWSAAV